MNYKDNSIAQAGDVVSGTDKNGKAITGKVVVAHRYFAIASEGKLIGELESKNFSKVADAIKVEVPGLPQAAKLP